jgi:hypothetical protein
MGVSKMYARVIDSVSKEDLKGFMKDHIKVEAKVRTTDGRATRRWKRTFLL